MKYFLILFVVFAPFMALADSGEPSSMSVVYNKTRPFNFTNSDEPDLLSLQVISGERCESTLMLYTIRRAKDHFPIFMETRTLSFYVDSGHLEVFSDCPAVIASNAERFWALHEKAVLTRDLSWIPEHEGHSFYEGEDVLNRALGAQLICMEGYESHHCSWFDPEAGGFKQILDYGF